MDPILLRKLEAMDLAKEIGNKPRGLMEGRPMRHGKIGVRPFLPAPIAKSNGRTELSEHQIQLVNPNLGRRAVSEAPDIPRDGTPVTLTALAYAQIRRDILSNAFEPGSRITIQFLQRRYNIGPTPVREALARLAAVGFVIGEDNRGFRVPPMSLSALRDVTDQRKLVESHGLRLSIDRGERTFRTELLEAHRQLELLNTSSAPDQLDGFLA